MGASPARCSPPTSATASLHHLLVHHLERVFEPRFIHDSYACRRGKGTAGRQRPADGVSRRVTANGHRPDLGAGFWTWRASSPPFHKQTLYEIIARQVRDRELLWLTRTVLFHDPTADYRFRSLDRSKSGPGTDDYPIPARKSLSSARTTSVGLPIGNLTSQFWANVYLNELDQFVKRRLRCRYYVRYVDDIVMLAEGRTQLLRWRQEIEQFLHARLGLTLRAERQEAVFVRRGIEFVGWRTWWNHHVPRIGTVSRMGGAVDVFRRRRVRTGVRRAGATARADRLCWR